MLSSPKTSAAASCVSRRSSNIVHAPARTMNVMCSATATTWDSWSTYLTKARNGAKAPTADEKVFSQMAVEVAKAAKTFKPRFGGGTAGTTVEVKKPAVARVKVASTVSSDLQKRLDKIGRQRLKDVVGVSADSAETHSFTTTEVGAALSVTAMIVEKGGEKSAAIVFLTTESERGVTWSRLEGLILHWAAADQPGGAWTMPASGWTAHPNKGSDAGGAWNSGFEKSALEGGNDTAYSLVLQLPLKGALKSSGLTYVLKAAEGQNTRWLKDASGDEDFFLDIQALPVVKA